MIEWSKGAQVALRCMPSRADGSAQERTNFTYACWE